jgi:2-desacetyl-2-hydroxyethyl bacteriochlorophyllide A dehydrogenase
MQLVEPGRFERVALSLQPPAPGRVRLALHGSGVCASNLPSWEGRDWFDYPLASGELGHEAWGVVDAVSDDVVDLAVGERVVCLGQRGYATHDEVEAADCVKLPEQVAGFPGEPVACVMNIAERCGEVRGRRVAVLGAGFLGVLLVNRLKAAGAEVTVVSRRPTGRDAAAAMAADRTLDLEQAEAEAEQVGGFFDGGRYDVVVEATGKQASLDLATRLVREMGRLVIAGFHQDGPRSIDMQLWNWRGLTVINAHERQPERYRQGLRAAVEAVANGELDPQRLITHRLPLENLGEAMQLTRQRPDGFLKAVVVTDGGAA